MERNRIDAFLFVTHKIDKEILDRYYTLQQCVKEIGKSFFLLNKEVDYSINTQKYVIPSNITPYIFNDNTLDELDYEPIAETIIPGSNHFATLQFFLDNPKFKYYWVIEYDVVYNGNWTDFFQNFMNLEVDFISSHIERFPDKPFWYWWDTLHLNDIVVHNHQLIKSFNPIYRISNNALCFLNNLLKGRKCWGHHEVLIPTVLKYGGFKILDFGGSGEFVLPQHEEKFYLMPSQYTNGTMRHMPQIEESEMLIKNKLLHPVKATNINKKENNNDSNLNLTPTNIELQRELMRLNKEILWGQIFQDTIRDSSWLSAKSFSPGRSAAGYPMLYLIYRILHGIKPQNILELGLGESSKLTIQYTKAHQKVFLNIIEHDKRWLDFLGDEIQDISSFVTICPIIQVPTEYNLYVNHYEDLLETVTSHIYDFIIIDGPWNSPWYSRNQIIEIVNNDLLAENFVIIMDDYNRKGEKQTINNLYDLLCKKNIPYASGIYSGNNDTIVICSDNYKFVTNL